MSKYVLKQIYIYVYCLFVRVMFSHQYTRLYMSVVNVNRVVISLSAVDPESPRHPSSHAPSLREGERTKEEKKSRKVKHKVVVASPISNHTQHHPVLRALGLLSMPKSREIEPSKNMVQTRRSHLFSNPVHVHLSYTTTWSGGRDSLPFIFIFIDSSTPSMVKKGLGLATLPGFPHRGSLGSGSPAPKGSGCSFSWKPFC